MARPWDGIISEDELRRYDAALADVDALLRAIVGFELTIESLEGKYKLSQNRPAVDVDGVVAGLRAEGDAESAAAVAAHRREA